MNGLLGQAAVQHVEQERNQELFKSKHNMGAKYVLDYHRGTVTPSPVQVSTFIIKGKWRRTQHYQFLKICVFPDLFLRYHKKENNEKCIPITI